MCFRKITAARGVQSRLEIQSKFGGLTHGLKRREGPCLSLARAGASLSEMWWKRAASLANTLARPDEREAMTTTGVVQAPRQAAGWRSWFVGKCDELS